MQARSVALQGKLVLPEDACGVVLLVRPALPQVRAPTLLITHGFNPALVKLNRSALSQLRCEKHMEIVPDVGHPSQAAQNVARLGLCWFEHHLVEEPQSGWDQLE